METTFSLTGAKSKGALADIDDAVDEMVLITGNTRRFKNIPGLRIENWIRPD